MNDTQQAEITQRIMAYIHEFICAEPHELPCRACSFNAAKLMQMVDAYRKLETA